MNVVILGAGRAGRSFAAALSEAGHEVALNHHDEPRDITGAELVLLCVPDDAISDVAASLDVAEGTVVAHCAGSRTLAVLAPHARRASLHPLVPLPNEEVGAARLRSATFAVAGDGVASEIVASLGGRAIWIDDSQRVAYHATACVTANHLVTLLAHAGRLAESAGLSIEDFLGLARCAIEDVERLGPIDALTGPASRGDVATIDAHLAAIPESERATYVALASAALALAEERSQATTA
jgi:predicted short-subunit dehydrogenase-like oxidoreductase (DUF2520 family)